MNFALQLLIGSFSAVLSLATATDRSFFTSVELRDSLSGYNYSLDPNHWFLIEAEMFVGEGQTEDVTLQIPNEFTALPKSPFSLLHHSKEIGKVVNNENVMTVSFPEPPSQNFSAIFNFLTKLDENALEGLTGPQDVEYDFKTSNGDLFKQVMHYEAKSLNEVVANGGIYSNNKTAWFTVDIPVSQLDRPVHITSQPKMGASKYMIDTTKTRCEMVSEVDSFNEPLKSIPFAPLEDRSSLSGINMKFHEADTMDGKYVRITYFTLPLHYSRVDSQVSFRKRSASGILKRDFKNNLELDIFGDPHVNLFPREDASQNSARFETYSNNTIPVSRSYSIPSSVLSSSATPSSVLASISGMSSIPNVTFAGSANAATPSSAAPSNGTSFQKLSSSSGTSTSSLTVAANATSSKTPSISSSAPSNSVNLTSVAPTSKSSIINAGVSIAPNSTSPAPTSSVSSSTTSSVSNSTLTSGLTSSSVLPSQTPNSMVNSTRDSTKPSSTVAQNSTTNLTAARSSVPSSSVLPTNSSTSSVTPASSTSGSNVSNFTTSSKTSTSFSGGPSSSLSNSTALRTSFTPSSSMLLNTTVLSRADVTPTSSSSSLINSTMAPSSSSASSSNSSNGIKYTQAPLSSSTHLSNSTLSSSPSGVSARVSPVISYAGNVSSTGFPSETFVVISSTGSGKISSFTRLFPISTIGTSNNASVTGSASPLETYNVIASSNNGEITSSTSWFPVATENPPKNSSIASTPSPYKTYNVIASSNNGEITSSTSWFPVATENPPKNSSIASSPSPYKTYNVIASSNNGEITSSTSWFPVATENPPKNSSITSSPSPYKTYNVITSTSNGELTSFTSWHPIVTENTKTNNSVPSITTGSSAEVYSSYVPITTTQNGVVKTHESWYPVTTRNRGPSNDTTDPQTRGYETYTVITGTENGQATSFTSWLPVSIQGTSGNGLKDTVTGSPTADLYSSCITTIRGGRVTSYNTWIPLATKSADPAVSDSSQVQGAYSGLTTNENGQQTTKTAWSPVNTLPLNYNATTFSTGTFKPTPGTQTIIYSSGIPFTANGTSTGTVFGQNSAIHESPYTSTATVSHQSSELGGNSSFGFPTEILQTTAATTTQFGQDEQTAMVSQVESTASSPATGKPSSGNDALPTATSHIDSGIQPKSTTFRTHRIVTTTINGAETGSNTQPTNSTPSTTNYSISYGSEETNLASSTNPSDGSSTPAIQTLTISYDTTQAVSTATNNGDTEPCSCFQMVETLTRVPGGAWSTLGVSQSPINTLTTSSSSINTKTPSGTVAKRDSFATKTNNVSQTVNLQTFEAGAVRPQVSLLSSIFCILVLFV